VPALPFALIQEMLQLLAGLATGFLIYAAFYIPISWIWPHPVLKWWWGVVTLTFWRVRPWGLKNIPETGPAVLVSNHVSYLDWMFIFAACPRRVRILVWSGYRRNPIWRFFIAWGRAIPIDNRNPTISNVRDVFAKARTVLAEGDLVLFFAESRLTRTGFMRPFHRGLEYVAREANVPIIPVCILNAWGSVFSYAHGKIVWKWPGPFPRRVAVGFGPPLPPTTEAAVVRQHVQRVGAMLAREANYWSRPAHRTFVRVAARRPLRSCFIDPMNKRELNYGKALAGVWVLRNWLKPRLGPEPMIGLWIPTSVGGALANVACTFLGKATANLNYTASPEAIRSAIRQAGIRQVLSSKMFVRKVPFDVPSHEAAPEGDKVQIIYLEDALSQIKNWMRIVAFLQVLLLPGWFLEYVLYRLGRHKMSDLISVIFTSGSTGEPKGVMLSHHNVMSNVDSVLAAVDLNKEDRALAVLPFFHSFGYTILLWGPISIGASAVYYPDPRAAKEIGALCKEYKCNLFLSTGTFLRFYLKRCEADDFRTLRLLVCGAEKLPVSLADEFKAKFGVLPLEGYGTTELSPIASSNVPEREIYGVKQIGNRPGTVGQPLPGIAAKVVDPQSYEEVPLGQEGLILITGGNVMVGYLAKPEKTAEVIRNGWYVTGDMGHLDPDGFMTLTGRLSRFAKVGGEMVPLEKVEEELHAALNSPDRVAAVTSVPDPAKGERLIVIHLAIPDVDARKLLQKLAERNLPNLWLPKERDVFQVPELPLLGTGKLDLKRVKEMALELVKRRDEPPPAGAPV
jgi:acyl-[acyl-carrier-protein]-phospholipid O-acyltransferase/long-chain-fatty-acid--[acyl-carrier-protein] ligase